MQQFKIRCRFLRPGSSSNFKFSNLSSCMSKAAASIIFLASYQSGTSIETWTNSGMRQEDIAEGLFSDATSSLNFPTPSSLTIPNSTVDRASCLQSEDDRPIKSLLPEVIRPMTSLASEGVLDLDRPSSENRLFRHVVLPNKMEVLLVSDPHCEKAACAVSVGVGSLSDPPDIHGMAHFLEHMLFLGTQKYPEDKEYDVFLGRNGGYSNAFTALDQTCYHFCVNPEHLDKAIDRLSQFFISPLFTPSATKRELNAINSEHDWKLLNDSYRYFHLLRQLANPKHPFSYFSAGNTRTLCDLPKQKGIDMREALQSFYKKYYSAHSMKVCVIGRESLNDLEKMVRKNRFELVHNTDNQPSKNHQPKQNEVPFRPEDLGVIVSSLVGGDAEKLIVLYLGHSQPAFVHVRVAPATDHNVMSFNWILPGQHKHWKTKPISYIMELLGHEGEGSLSSTLKAESLATGVGCGFAVNLKEFAVLSVTIDLTKHAANKHDNIERVAQLVHQYIKFLSTNEIQEYILNEMEEISKTKFTFKSKETSLQDAISLVSNMLLYPPKQLISAPFLFWKRDLNGIKKLAKFLRPENMIVRLGLNSFKSEAKIEKWKTDPYCQIRFKVEPINKKTLSRWCSESIEKNVFHFPKPNSFITQNFELRQYPQPKINMPLYPQLLSYSSSNMKCRLYFKQDQTFHLPKGVMTFRFYYDFPRQDVRAYMLNRLYLKTVQELLNEYTYNASVAGLDYSLHDSPMGMELTLIGYNEKLPLLLEKICECLRRPKWTLEAFETAKASLMAETQTIANNMNPVQQAFNLKKKYTSKPYYSPAENLAVLRTLKYKDICKLANDEEGVLFQGLSVDVLVLGNFVEKDAMEIMDHVDRIFFEKGKIQQSKKLLKPLEIADLRDPNGELVRIRFRQLCCNPDEVVSSSVLGIHMGPLSAEDYGYLYLTQVFLDKLFYAKIRTEQQIGYIVNVVIQAINHCPSLLFLVASSRMAPEDITLRIEAFVEEFLKMPEKHLSEKDFEDIKQSVISNLETKPRNLQEESSRYLTEMNLLRFEFDRTEKMAASLKTLTRDRFLKYLSTKLYILPWTVAEIKSQKLLSPSSGTEIPNIDNSVLLQPSTAVRWKDAGEDTKEFFSTYVKSFYEVPLPGTTLKIREGA